MEPFRDEMSAAMMRADQLEDENEELRAEVERLRTTAHAKKAESPDDELADQTLRVLEKLDVVSQRRPQVRIAETATPALPSNERADLRDVGPALVVAPLVPPAVEKGSAPPTSWPTAVVLFAAFAGIAFGVVLGWLAFHP